MAIVVSHIASDFESLRAQALRQARLSDLVELRLDRIGDPGEERLAAFVRECPRPVIVAVHGAEGFGEFEGSIEERLAILRTAARAGASFVDVDWRLSLELGEVGGKCHRIVSRHEHEETPQDLEGMHEEVREVLHEGDLVKLVTHARSTEDGLRLLRYLRQRGKGLVAFCSGEAGSFTRLVAPILGSPFTYAAPAELPGMPAAEPTAPGQLRVNDLLGIAPPGGLGPGTAIFGVVGRPIAHSWSPRVHGMALKGARLDALYLAFEPESLESFLALAEDENFRGFSITAPFKEAAFRAARSADRASQACGAANTLVRQQHGWRAFNTDVPAIRDTLERAFALHASKPGRPVALSAAHSLVLGTGGAARAALQALRELGVRATVAGRSEAKARELARTTGVESVAWESIGELAYDVLVHCTPVGSLAQPGELAIPASALRAGTLVLDAVYRPLRTPLLLEAQRRGCTAVPGGEWFVRQAQEQFRLFTGAEPDEALVRAAFEHALADG